MGNRTSGKVVATAERRVRVLELRKRGLPYRRIAEQVLAEFGADVLPKHWDQLYAYKDVQRELEKLQRTLREDAASIRATELERLNMMLERLWEMIEPEGNKTVDNATVLYAIDRMLKVTDRRLRLVPDLDQPIAMDEVVIRVIGGVDLDEL